MEENKENVVKQVNSAEQVVQNTNQVQNSNNTDEKAPVILRIISFFIPLVGLIIYLCSYDNNRKYGNACGIPALIGFILGVVLIPLIIFIFIIGIGIFAYNSAQKLDYNVNDGDFTYYYDSSNIDEKLRGLDEWDL